MIYKSRSLPSVCAPASIEIRCAIQPDNTAQIRDFRDNTAFRLSRLPCRARPQEFAEDGALSLRAESAIAPVEDVHGYARDLLHTFGAR